jgi:hypothetical protein
LILFIFFLPVFFSCSSSDPREEREQTNSAVQTIEEDAVASENKDTEEANRIESPLPEEPAAAEEQDASRETVHTQDENEAEPAAPLYGEEQSADSAAEADNGSTPGPIRGDETEVIASKDDYSQDESIGAPEKEQPLPLSMQEIFRLLPNLFLDPVQPLETDNRPYVLLYDLDQDQIPEIFVPAVDAGQNGSSSLSELSDFTRVYDDKSGRPVFFIYVFEQEHGELKLLHRIRLGRKPAIASLVFKRISAGSPVPVSLVASFHFVEGEEINWLNFKGIDSYSLLSVQTSVDVQIREADINSDSYLDILIFRKKVEEGIGYEKYISWMQWQKEEFVQTAVTNIVRNLREYLAKTKSLLTASKWNAFLQDALSEADYNKIVENNSAPEEVIPMIFTPVVLEEGEKRAFNYFTRKRKISEIIFPEISRSPFDPAGTAVFSPLVRIVCCQGEAGIFSCRIKMNKNPFQEQQFFYLLE